MTGRSAIIVGAGIAGLAAAWQLRRIGWDATVVERSPSLREGGYMLGLSGPGYATASRMGLIPELEKASYAIAENVYRDRRGRELMRLRYRDLLRDVPYLALRRTDIVGTLRAALPDDLDLRLGVTVASLDNRPDGVDVTLSDGATLSADLLIAAEGLRSATRASLFDESECYAPLGYRFAVYDIDDTLKLGSDFLSYVEPGHMAEYYALAGGRLAALHVWRDSHEENPAAFGWDLLKSVARASHPAVREMMTVAEAGPLPIIDSLTMVALPRWSKDRVLLLGDAAHCLTLVSGQGGGISMASAEILGHALGRASTVDVALAEHETRLRPTIDRLQHRSRRMAAVFIPGSPFAFHMRNTILKHMPRAWLGKYLANSVRSEIELAGREAA